METGVYHLESSIPKGTRNHFGTTVMSVQARFGDEYPDFLIDI